MKCILLWVAVLAAMASAVASAQPHYGGHTREGLQLATDQAESALEFFLPYVRRVATSPSPSSAEFEINNQKMRVATKAFMQFASPQQIESMATTVKFVCKLPGQPELHGLLDVVEACIKPNELEKAYSFTFADWPWWRFHNYPAGTRFLCSGCGKEMTMHAFDPTVPGTGR